MKYVWIVTLVILYLIWLVTSIFDLVFSLKIEKDLNFSTGIFVAFHIEALLIYSFYLWISDH